MVMLKEFFLNKILLKQKYAIKWNFKTLSSHFIIVMNEPELKDFDFEKAFDV